jgi:archaellum component FlaC
MTYKGGSKMFKIGSITLSKSAPDLVNAINGLDKRYKDLLSQVNGSSKIGLF